jgi:hypothetical protein
VCSTLPHVPPAPAQYTTDDTPVALILPSTHQCPLPLPLLEPVSFPLLPHITSSRDPVFTFKTSVPGMERIGEWSELRNEGVGINFPDMSVWVRIRDTSSRGRVLHSSKPHPAYTLRPPSTAHLCSGCIYSPARRELAERASGSAIKTLRRVLVLKALPRA